METGSIGVVSSREGKRPSERVVEAVATVEDSAPAELQRPLYSAVDPDSLVTGGGGDTGGGEEPTGVDAVSFTYLGHDVVVSGDGTVSVDGG